MKLESEGSKLVQEGLSSVRCLVTLSFGSGVGRNTSIFLRQREGSKKFGDPCFNE